MIKAILFDLDNTLIDFMKMKKRCCETAIDAMIAAGLKMTRKKAMKILYEHYTKYGIEYQQIFQKFLKVIKGRVDYKIIAHGILAYRKVKESYLVPYPHVISTLIELKKTYKLAIISDAPRIEAWMRLVAMKLDDFFDVVITAADVRKKKIHPAPFKAALKALKIKPEEALMVGDRLSRDILPAQKLNIRTCFARYGARYNDEEMPEKGKSGADYEISNIKELLKLKL
ncbi:MAG: TIGR02253 family HAD-type hydrolase [Candidatus Pacearchaeota archaeon]|nr:TIGR02253 family HAD-type hydrolase [Candidatus Pacearchaeota archaeon]